MQPFDALRMGSRPPRQRIASVWPFLSDPIYQAIFPVCREPPAILANKRAGQISASLGTSATKQRLGYTSAHLEPATIADRVDPSSA